MWSMPIALLQHKNIHCRFTLRSCFGGGDQQIFFLLLQNLEEGRGDYDEETGKRGY
jgi:hypothetical protein